MPQGPAITVRDIMTSPVVTVREDTSLEAAARLMLEHDIGSLPVVDETGKLRGIVTESDFTGRETCPPFSFYRVPTLFGEWVSPQELEAMYKAGRTMKVCQIMSSPVVTTTEDTPVTKVVMMMLERDLTRIPVVRDGVPVGIVTRHNLLKLLVRDSSAT